MVTFASRIAGPPACHPYVARTRRHPRSLGTYDTLEEAEREAFNANEREGGPFFRTLNEGEEVLAGYAVERAGERWIVVLRVGDRPRP